MVEPVVRNLTLAQEEARLAAIMVEIERSRATLAQAVARNTLPAAKK